jgi:hypothetical protein
MKVLFVLTLLAALIFLVPESQAQGVIQQYGSLFAGDSIMSQGNNRAVDAGNSSVPTLPGTRPVGFGVVNSGLGFCQWSPDPGANTAWNQLCWGFNSSGAGVINYSNINTATNSLLLQVNGNTDLTLSNIGVTGTTQPCSDNSALLATDAYTHNCVSITGGITAASNSVLETIPSTATTSVVRLGFTTAGDAPPLQFISSNSACSLNSGAGDGGSQVPSADGKCWLAQFSATGADWREWGVKFDNSTNNSAALQAADTWAPANAGTLVGPAGIARFSTPLVVDAAGNGNWSWRGSQKSTTEFLYTGGSSDIITAGNSGGTFMNYVNISDIYVDSINQLSSGYALHLNYTNFSTLHNIRIGGQQGNGNLWNSIYFDGYYNDTISGNSDISGQNVGISVAGLGSEGANLLIEDNTNIVPPVSKNGCINNAAVCEKIGLLMGGGAGGVVCSGANFEANGVNWQVDESLTGTANREFSLVGGCIIDSTRGGDDVLLNDANAGDAAQAIFANWWIASACSSSATITPACSGSGVHVENYLNGNVAIKTGVIWNIANGDAIRIDDATTKVKIDPGTLLHDFTGYGINCTVSTTNVYPGSFPHDDGRSWTGMYAPDCNLASGLGTNNGYLRNPDGTYREWQQVTFASGQLANTQLLPTGGTGSPPVMVALPLPFPNGWNGQPVCTVSSATSSTGLAALYASSSGSSAFNLYGVSNVNLTNPMTASCDSFGY